MALRHGARLLAVSSLVAVLGLAGCTERVEGVPGPRPEAAEIREPARDREPARNTSNPVAAAAASTGDRIDDMQLTTRVNAGLAADKALSAMRINVDTQDGVVTLMGTAPTLTAKARAAEIAREVKGVKSVNNQLSVGG